MTVQVSVVVPTYKRAELLDRCLQALISQDFDPSSYEIIVADDAADEQTEQVAARWSCRTDAYRVVPGEVLQVAEGASPGREGSLQTAFPSQAGWERVPGLPQIRYIPIRSTSGPAAARNCGWRTAAGEIIAFTDDDCVPARDWLKRGVSAFQDGVMGVSGRVEVPLPDRPTDYEREMLGLVRSFFVTANCFYHRQALEAVGGFDERFPLAWREDSDLFFRMVEQGYRLRQAPDAVVVHPVRPAPWGISLVQQRKSMYNALVYKKHPELYRLWLQARPPWHYYGIVLALVVAFGAALVENRLLAQFAAICWGLLTIRFTWQRLQGTSHSSRHVAEMLLTSVLVPPLSVYWRIRGAVKYRVLFL